VAYLQVKREELKEVPEHVRDLCAATMQQRGQRALFRSADARSQVQGYDKT